VSTVKPSHLLLQDAAKVSADLRQDSKTIAFVNGCFDPLHHGHIKLLQSAKAQADIVFVGVNSDAGVQNLKGIDRPRIPLTHRISTLAELRCIDFIVDYDENTAAELIRLIRPTIVVKGADYNRATTLEREVIDEVGAKLLITDYVQGSSSIRLVGRDRLDASAGSRIHLVADLALDTYLLSEANTLSREFPNVVCANATERSTLGGGGNLALSLKRQSALSSMVGVVGESLIDDTVCRLLRSLELENLSLSRVAGPFCTHYKKILARCVSSTYQEILRIDEVPERLNMGAVWDRVREAISYIAISAGDIVVVSAYEELSRSTVGFAVRSLLQEVANERGAILIGACRYGCKTLRGFDFIVVNEQECLEALTHEHCAGRVTLEMVNAFAALVSPSQVVVTTGERGAMYFSRESGKVFTVNTMPCPPGTDPTGAGDVFLAAFAGEISRGASMAVSVSTAVRCATSALFNAPRPAIVEHQLPMSN